MLKRVMVRIHIHELLLLRYETQFFIHKAYSVICFLFGRGV
jgi:hypothetical protein